MKTRRAFTLMEIVLAIGLTSVVMYLLITAIELYMVRVDSSRSRVESAQVGRTLLDQMAADLSAMRLYAPAAQGGGGSGGMGGGGFTVGGQSGQNGGGSGGNESGGGGYGQGGGDDGSSGGGFAGDGAGPSGSGTGSSSTMPASTSVQGVFGTVDQIRVDRGAAPNWSRAAREVTLEEPATISDMPTSVRYYFVTGDRLTSQQFAARGVPEDEATAVAETTGGLYREVVTTASIADQIDPLAPATQMTGTRVELLAPEVVKMELAYFDGTQLLTAWDSIQEGGPPAGVEIRLTIYEPDLDQPAEPQPTSSLERPTYRESELVEYRRFVRLPKMSPPQPAEQLLPGGGQGGGQGGRGGGQGEQENGGGGGQDGGGGGGGNNGGGNGNGGGGGGGGGRGGGGRGGGGNDD